MANWVVQTETFLSVENMEPIRRVVHDYLIEHLPEVDGIRPNEFATNDQEAADYAAQDDNMAMKVFIGAIIHSGFKQMMDDESVVFDDLYLRLLDPSSVPRPVPNSSRMAPPPKS